MFLRVQKNKENPYVMLNKSFLLDPELSAKAKGLLSYLFTLPDDWQIYGDELVNHFKDGRDSIRTGLKELIDEGYIVRERIRNEKGQLKHYIYDVYEISTKNGKSNLGKSNKGKTNIGKSNTTKYLSLPSNNKPNNNTQPDIKTLCVDIQNILGTELSQKTVKDLIKKYTLEKVQHYMDNWDKYRDFADGGQDAFFIHCIQHNRPVPTPKKKSATTPLPHQNFEQREYEDSVYDKFYANLNGDN